MTSYNFTRPGAFGETDTSKANYTPSPDNLRAQASIDQAVTDASGHKYNSLKERLDNVDSYLTQNTSLTGLNTGSIQTTYDGSGNLTQAKELDSSSNLLVETDITYNPDGTVNTITEKFNGKTYVTTLNYTGGSLSTTNPFTRSVS